MKARPIKWVNTELVECPPEEATHVTIHIPGPTGRITLPVMIGGTRSGTGNWTWNGSVDFPTLKPSVLHSCGCFDPASKPEDMCWCKYNEAHPDEQPTFHCFRCHTHINDGKAEFLADCTHEHAGKTLELLDV